MTVKYTIEDNKLILGKDNCRSCTGTPGQVWSGKMENCPKCKGTGKRGNGKWDTQYYPYSMVN